MESLDKNLFIELVRKTSNSDMINLCIANKQNNAWCNDPNLWRLLLIQDFGVARSNDYRKEYLLGRINGKINLFELNNLAAPDKIFIGLNEELVEDSLEHVASIVLDAINYEYKSKLEGKYIIIRTPSNYTYYIPDLPKLYTSKIDTTRAISPQYVKIIERLNVEIGHRQDEVIIVVCESDYYKLDRSVRSLGFIPNCWVERVSIEELYKRPYFRNVYIDKKSMKIIGYIESDKLITSDGSKLTIIYVPNIIDINKFSIIKDRTKPLQVTEDLLPKQKLDSPVYRQYHKS